MHPSLGFARTFIFMCVTIAMSNAQLHREQPLQPVPVLDGRCKSPNPLRMKYLILKSFKAMFRGLFSIRRKDGTRWCFILYIYMYICILPYLVFVLWTSFLQNHYRNYSAQSANHLLFLGVFTHKHRNSPKMQRSQFRLTKVTRVHSAKLLFYPCGGY